MAKKPTIRLSLGADPELFVRDIECHEYGGIIPVCGWLGGTKGQPQPLDDASRGYFVQEDGITAEFNIPPAASATEFTDTVTCAVTLLQHRITAKSENYRLYPAPYVELPQEYLMRYYPDSYRFGCSPEFDAYAEGAPVPPVSENDLALTNGVEYRFAGGHLHIGMANRGVYSLPIPKYVLAAFFDLAVGLPSVARDTQGPRRQLYGQAGRFRPTKYGIEYRVLSNYWVLSESRSSRVAARAFTLMQFLSRHSLGAIMHAFESVPWGEVRAAINTEDVLTAAQLVQYNDELLDNVREVA